MSPYPSPPYDHMDSINPSKSSPCHVLQQTPPPTLREILSAYKSNGNGDRDMLLAMLKAKTAEDQRIAAIASLHQTILDNRVSSHTPSHDQPPPFTHAPTPTAYQLPPAFTHPATFSTVSPTASPRDMKLPPIQTCTSPPRKRARTSQSPPPTALRRRYSTSQPVAPSEQLPPSPPFSSPGRSGSTAAELQPHTRPMAIGSLLTSSSSSTSNQNDTDTEWPSRTSAERTGSAIERDTHRRQSTKASS